MKKLLCLIFPLVAFLAAMAQEGSSTYKEFIEKHREAYKQDFIADERSPLKEKDLDGLQFYAPNEAFKVACTLELTPDEKPFEMPTSSGRTKPFRKYGILHFEIGGVPCQLAVYQNIGLRNMPQYAQHLFLPFRDLTNGETTYGGGRYIDLSVADLEVDKPELDFNKCYNPWCHYSDGYNCPIPPTENNLEVAIEAGEKLWIGEKKHK
jgi:uncharacterized protein (DUF1684 family)